MKNQFSGLVATLALLAVQTALADGISREELLSVQEDPSTWLMYGKNYSAWRYSEMTEINASNVARLVPQWIFQTGETGNLQTTPLVFDDLMFLTGSSNHAWAVDLLTGKAIWHYWSKVPKAAQGCCGQPNRGFAALGEKLFKVNFEAALVALDAKTGEVLWETKIADYKKGYSATGAPLVVKHMVVTGIAGAEFGTRDFLDAYDAETGERIWRFWTTAAPGEPGGDTWQGDSWKRGGGSTWITGTYDPELNLIYWGTGNPGPDMDGDVRPGDNLYTCSIIALDADTGHLVWHYQTTPHDVHDWDAVADPVLLDLEVEGKTVKALVQANRNGFFYALDRTNGKLLFAKPYTKVTWADGIGLDGRPILIPGKDPTEEGNVACPGLGGGHNWHATAYSPQTGLYYFDSTDGCQIYYKTRQGYIEGQWYQASTTSAVPDEPPERQILAVDPANGQTQWKFTSVSGSGLLATAGGLVFAGDSAGYFMALDARTGKPLWRFQTGGPIRAPPITYRFRGRQHVVIPAGAAVVAFALPEGSD